MLCIRNIGLATDNMKIIKYHFSKVNVKLIVIET